MPIKDLVYYSSYLYIGWIAIRLSLGKGRALIDDAFLVGVALVPVGKLFYLPISGFDSVKMSVIYFAAVSGVFFLFALIRGFDFRILFPLFFVVPPLLSVVFVDAALGSWFTTANPLGGTGDTPLLRLSSIVLSSVICCFVIHCIMRRPDARRDMAVIYLNATVFACLIGSLIYYGLVTGQLSIADVQPISIQVQAGGAIYRFNPGANVNEFGQIAGYALILLKWAPWTRTRKTLTAIVLLAAEFLGLTRGAWIALVVAALVMATFTEARTRRAILVLGAVGAAVLLIVAINSDLVWNLLINRTSLSLGVGGEERLTGVTRAFDNLDASWLRLLFGFGWAADFGGEYYGYGFDYLHNVPVMMFFDTGFVGFLIYISTFIAIVFLVVGKMGRRADVPLALLTFYFVASLFEHNFYHTQTWLMLGVAIGCALSERTVQGLTVRLPADAIAPALPSE